MIKDDLLLDMMRAMIARTKQLSTGYTVNTISESIYMYCVVNLLHSDFKWLMGSLDKFGSDINDSIDCLWPFQMVFETIVSTCNIFSYFGKFK
jgi:hypothetical protein